MSLFSIRLFLLGKKGKITQYDCWVVFVCDFGFGLVHFSNYLIYYKSTILVSILLNNSKFYVLILIFYRVLGEI